MRGACAKNDQTTDHFSQKVHAFEKIVVKVALPHAFAYKTRNGNPDFLRYAWKFYIL